MKINFGFNWSKVKIVQWCYIFQRPDHYFFIRDMLSSSIWQPGKSGLSFRSWVFNGDNRENVTRGQFFSKPSKMQLRLIICWYDTNNFIYNFWEYMANKSQIMADYLRRLSSFPHASPKSCSWYFSLYFCWRRRQTTKRTWTPICVRPWICKPPGLVYEDRVYAERYRRWRVLGIWHLSRHFAGELQSFSRLSCAELTNHSHSFLQS